MAKVACITTLQAAPGRRDELLEVCRRYAKSMLAGEPGTLRMEFLLPFENSDGLVIWDVYESVEAVDAHRNGERLKRFIEETKGILVRISGVRHTFIE